jgi:hypothetical protein
MKNAMLEFRATKHCVLIPNMHNLILHKSTELLGTFYALKLKCVAYSVVKYILDNTVICSWKWELSRNHANECMVHILQNNNIGQIMKPGLPL